MTDKKSANQTKYLDDWFNHEPRSSVKLKYPMALVKYLIKNNLQNKLSRAGKTLWHNLIPFVKESVKEWHDMTENTFNTSIYGLKRFTQILTSLLQSNALLEQMIQDEMERGESSG